MPLFWQEAGVKTAPSSAQVTHLLVDWNEWDERGGVGVS